MSDEEVLSLVCGTKNIIIEGGGHVTALTPRLIYDPALCGSCAQSNRLIYSEYAFLDILTKELIRLRFKQDCFLAPEVYERFQDEAISLYTQFILNLAFISPIAPIFLNDE